MLRTEQDLAFVGIIPARFGSTRLLGTPLSDTHGKTLIDTFSAPPVRRRAWSGTGSFTTGQGWGSCRADRESGLTVDTSEDRERARALPAPQKGRQD